LSVNFIEKDKGGGTFYPIHLSLLLTGLYLPLAVYGIVKTVRTGSKELRPFLIALGLTLFLIVIKAPFFKRIFIIIDIILIIYAAFGFFKILEIRKYYIFILILFALVFTVKTGDKLITPEYLEEISSSKKIISNQHLVSTAKENTAWLLGYTDAKVIAWNYGGYEKFWTDKQWTYFLSKDYSLKEKAGLLELLPAPAYLYADNNSSKGLYELLHSEYTTQISKHIYLINTSPYSND